MNKLIENINVVDFCKWLESDNGYGYDRDDRCFVLEIIGAYRRDIYVKEKKEIRLNGYIKAKETFRRNREAKK
jgi:hypothetical protein